MCKADFQSYVVYFGIPELLYNDLQGVNLWMSKSWFFLQQGVHLKMQKSYIYHLSVPLNLALWCDFQYKSQGYIGPSPPDFSTLSNGHPVHQCHSKLYI